jgi:hypothetical protein
VIAHIDFDLSPCCREMMVHGGSNKALIRTMV